MPRSKLSETHSKKCRKISSFGGDPEEFDPIDDDKPLRDSRVHRQNERHVEDLIRERLVTFLVKGRYNGVRTLYYI